MVAEVHEDSHEKHGTKPEGHGASHGGTQHGQAGNHIEIQPIPVTLADSSTMQLLQTDWLKPEASSDPHHESEERLSSTFWLIVSLLVCFIILAVIGTASGLFRRLSLRNKLYASFGSLIALATILGLGAYLNLVNVNGYGDLATIFMQLEVQAGKAASHQNNFLLHGIENRKYGDNQVSWLQKTLQDLQADIDLVKVNGLVTGQQSAVIEELQKEVNEYEKKLSEVITAFHEVETIKEELDEAARGIDGTLEEMVVHHEKALADAEAAGSDLKEISRQTVIVEHLLASEIHGLKMAHAEIEFLLDKNPKHVGVMATELGLFKGYLRTMEHEIDDQEEVKQLMAIEKSLESYEAKLVKVIADEAILAKDLATMNALLHQFTSSCEVISKEAEAIAHHIVKEAVLSLFFLVGFMLVTS